MRAITVTQREHIGAAAVADVSPAINARIAGCLGEGVASGLVDELGRGLDAIDACDEPMRSFDAFRSDIGAQSGQTRPV